MKCAWIEIFFYLIDEPKDQLYGEIQILMEWQILEMVFSNITEGIFSYTVIGNSLFRQ